jgi:Putative bacterial sensory transduction regulator
MNPALRNLRDQVDACLERLEIDSEPTAEGIHVLRCGSSMLFLSCFEHEGRPYVRIVAMLLLGFHPKMELFGRLLRLNSRVLFGSFQLFDDETVCFTHTLAAHSGLDFDTFSHALRYVGQVADDHDEPLQALAGGERGEELLE